MVSRGLLPYMEQLKSMLAKVMVDHLAEGLVAAGNIRAALAAHPPAGTDLNNVLYVNHNHVHIVAYWRMF